MDGQRLIARSIRRGVAAAVGALAIIAAWQALAHDAPHRYGIAAKRPVVQAACKYCPWGQIADILKRIMAPAYDLAICYSCSGENGVRFVSKRLVGAEISDRQYAQGTTYRPEGPIDFGITTADRVRMAYEGEETYKKDGPLRNLRVIARIESPQYLMVAVVKSSGITDLRQIRERKMPVRMIIGNGGGIVDDYLAHYGLSAREIREWGGRIQAGNSMFRNPNFDVILGVGVLSNYPEGNMWYEMSQKKDLVFLQIPEDLRRRLAQVHRGELVDLPFRYLRGLDDDPHPTVGISGHAVYGRDDLPDTFVHDIARGLDEKRGLLRWANQPFTYDPATVWNGGGVPLHPGASRYYRERGYMR